MFPLPSQLLSIPTLLPSPAPGRYSLKCKTWARGVDGTLWSFCDRIVRTGTAALHIYRLAWKPYKVDQSHAIGGTSLCTMAPFESSISCAVAVEGQMKQCIFECWSSPAELQRQTRKAIKETTPNSDETTILEV